MAKASSEEEANLWRRRLGSEANNRGWDLAEKSSRTPEEDAEMLHAAHASRHLWTTIGNERNVADADLLLGHVHALLGRGPTATEYAARALSYFTSRPSEASGLAFAYAVQANAAFVCGDPTLHRNSYAKARGIADTLVNPQERRIFDATFNAIPKPGSASNAS